MVQFYVSSNANSGQLRWATQGDLIKAFLYENRSNGVKNIWVETGTLAIESSSSGHKRHERLNWEMFWQDLAFW